MSVNSPTKTNFLYRFELGNGRNYFYTNIASSQVYDGEEYLFVIIEHTAPTYSEDDEDSEIDVTMKSTTSEESNPVSDLFLLSPPPYEVRLVILEYDRVAETAEPYYEGWIVRSPFDLEKKTVTFHLKTLWLFFERETFTDSLSALSRYSIFDPRSGVDVEALRETVTVTELNEFRDEMVVTGIGQADGWFDGGIFSTPDRDPRTILEHKTVAGDTEITITHPYPQALLDVGFTADVYPGDDLTFETWSVKFGVPVAFGGWPYMPDRDPAVGGVR